MRDRKQQIKGVGSSIAIAYSMANRFAVSTHIYTLCSVLHYFKRFSFIRFSSRTYSLEHCSLFLYSIPLFCVVLKAQLIWFFLLYFSSSSFSLMHDSVCIDSLTSLCYVNLATNGHSSQLAARIAYSVSHIIYMCYTISNGHVILCFLPFVCGH